MKNILYKVWGFFRQTAIRLHLSLAKAIYKISGGKLPKSLFCTRANPEKVGTDVKIISQNDYSTTIAKVDDKGNIKSDDFVIVTSTDFHFSEDHDLNTKAVNRFVRHIKEVKPDLVILTGDNILSKYQQIDAIQFAKMMEEIGVYWTATFGNHETREDRGFYKWLLWKSFCDYDHCLCKYGPDELFGYGNHTVNILGEGGKLKKTLFLFDSGRDILERDKAKYKLPSDAKGYDFLKNEQIDFYKNEVDKLIAQYGGNAGSFLYFHIPLVEYNNVFKADENGRFIPSGEGEILHGEQYESVGSSRFNSGMFDAILEKGGQAVFCGHDHINDWCAIYKGVHLTYNLPGGYACYNMGSKIGKPETEWVEGVTVTAIHNDGTFDIYPRYNRIYL